jgi:hypothetical protein
LPGFNPAAQGGAPNQGMDPATLQLLQSSQIQGTNPAGANPFNQNQFGGKRK